MVGEEDGLEPQVFVRRSRVMQLRDRVHQGAYDVPRVSLGVVPPGDDTVEEIAALEKLHD